MSHTKSQFRLNQPLTLVGVATNDWQWNPLDSGSDWGHELARAQRGYSHHFNGEIDRSRLPSFDAHSRPILDRAKQVGGNAIRLSLDFGRLCPRKGEVREDVLAGYIRQIVYCRSLGLEPVVTLHHWTQPKSFAKFAVTGEMIAGPLEHPGIVDHFAFYVHRVADAFTNPGVIRRAIADEGYDESFVDAVSTKPLCRTFISINEPVNLLYEPYVTGFYPPFQVGRFDKIARLRKAVRQMHVAAHDILHVRLGADVAVGMAHHVTSDHWLLVNHAVNWGLLEDMERGLATDFLGIQHYFRFRLGFRTSWPFLTRRGNDPRYWSDQADFGQVHPEGAGQVLREASKRFPGKPLYLSEFGFADSRDEKRPAWILDAVESLIDAKNDGVDVRGAFLWTLIDNLEWNRGADATFGLFDINGDRLPTDCGGVHVSSREVWSLASAHLRHPTETTAAALAGMQERAWEQLERGLRKGENPRHGTLAQEPALS